MKLPFDKLRDKKPQKGKKMFFSGNEDKVEPSTESAPPGVHSKKKKRRKLKKKIVIPVALLVVLAGIFGVRHFFLSGKGEVTQTFTESEASRQDIQLTLSATGTIEPANQYDVTSSVQGEVLSCTFEEGDEVKKGDTLYEIDSTDAQNSIEQAQLSLQQSQNSYNQTVESLDDLNIKSEKAGVVTKLYVDEGDQVQAGATIADVRDSSSMELTVPFNASDAATFSVGSAATVTMDSSFETLTGTVTAIDAADTVLDGYQIVRYVTIRVSNPGGLSTSSAASATINGVACNQGANFTYLSEFTITADTAGKVASLSIREGSSVSAGQTVATLSSTSVENQVENSKLSLAQQQLSYQNTVDKLDDYTITAPIDGTVITKNTKVGDTLDATNGQTTLAVIYDLSYLTFDISLDELDINQVTVGQTVNITCDSLEDAGTIEGVVTKVSVAGTTENGVTSYPVTVQIDNPPEDLLPGMNVDATIVVDEAPDAVAVPISAVQRGNIVYVKDDSAKNTDGTMVNGTLLPDGWKAVEVETGLSDDNYIEIVSGIAEGDIVYVPQVMHESSSEESEMGMMPGGGMGGMAGGDMGAMPAGGGGGGMPSGGGGSMPSGGGGGGMP
ncbi:efflux RND transporter periplasmic adaptor subunit [Agathobaculum sp. Marseille-P7918]|uniref:efflux RND transporter periplasmic adaptor subunit n=1 Tax=Agathobaculum sp. Marseille-P7918 TaxID=2479843 RepID=UPI0035644EA8